MLKGEGLPSQGGQDEEERDSGCISDLSKTRETGGSSCYTESELRALSAQTQGGHGPGRAQESGGADRTLSESPDHVEVSDTARSLSQGGIRTPSDRDPSGSGRSQGSPRADIPEAGGRQGSPRADIPEAGGSQGSPDQGLYHRTERPAGETRQDQRGGSPDHRRFSPTEHVTIKEDKSVSFHISVTDDATHGTHSPGPDISGHATHSTQAPGPDRPGHHEQMESEQNAVYWDEKGDVITVENEQIRSITGGNEAGADDTRIRFPPIIQQNQNNLLSNISRFTVQSNPARMDVLEITRTASVYTDSSGPDNHTDDNTGDGFVVKSRQSTYPESCPPDVWSSNNGESELRLPELKCSMYRAIGDPRLKRRPERRRKERTWRTPRLVKLGTLAGNKHNAVDTRTIYSRRNAELWETLTTPSVLLPPLQASPRFRELRHEARLLQEKGIVMRDFFSTGKIKRFARDKAVIPTVYSDFFQCPSRKRNYVTNMYTNAVKKKQSADCTKPKFQGYIAESDTCQYCDVIGNKYCASCIEYKNRHFALGYEKSVAPDIRPRNDGKGITRDVIAEISKSLDKFELESKQTKEEVNKQLAALALSPRKPKVSSVYR